MPEKRDPFEAGINEALKNLESDPAKSWRLKLDIPETDDELWDWVDHHLNIQIPRNSCCEDHSSPFDAFAEAYFARTPRSVWLASRLCGKTVLLATLSLTEAITLGASVILLGGSGEQSARVHAYVDGEDTNLPNSFLAAPDSPKWLWRGQESTKRKTLFKNGGRLKALMASSKSIRGPHPSRLRADELDEFDPALWDAAMGQAMPSKGVKEQVLASSTWHNPNGVMTEEIKMARRKGFPLHIWCWRCILEENGGWLSRSFVERKKATIPDRVWRVEFDLSRPTTQDSFIMQDAVEWTFDSELGDESGEINQSYIFEEPVEEGEYATAADWGKSRDRTIIVTLRTDIDPMRVVQYSHMGQLSFPIMVDKFNEVVKKYDSFACHDATGLGAVIHDYLDVLSEDVVLQGNRRKVIFSNYVRAIEQHEIKSPDIHYMKDEHLYAITSDFYGTGHPPDSIVAMALAYRASDTLDVMY